MKQNPAYIQQQISEKKLELEGIEDQIQSLRKQRATTEAIKTGPLSRIGRVETIDGDIRELERRRQNAPFEIEELEKKLLQTQKDEEYDKKILLTAPSLSEGQRLSKILLKQLEGAKTTSDRLIEMYQARNAIRRQTDQPLAAPRVCSGFYSLKLLVEIAKRESNGQGGRVSHRYKNLPEQLI